MTPEERALTLSEDFMKKFYGMEISYSEYMYQSILKLLTDAISEERDACAKIAQEHHKRFVGHLDKNLSRLEETIGKNIARAIRASVLSLI